MSPISDPFGQADCESEVAELQERYQELYFGQTPFNASAMEERTYLIVGRRGAGKTALSHYFSFQTRLRGALVIDVDEPREYQKVLSRVARRSDDGSDLAVPRAREIWTYLLWCLIFENTKGESDQIEAACAPCSAGLTHAGILNAVVDWLLGQFKADDPERVDRAVAGLLEADVFAKAVDSVLARARQRPIIVAVDTLEKYDVSDSGLMSAIAGLVEAAAAFHVRYASTGVHVKVFVSGEIFPFLKEHALLNPLKSVKNPVHMLWRPKDLLRLISWRFHRFLSDARLAGEPCDIDWDNPRDVLARAWAPYFGTEVRNQRNEIEHSFAYVLRHTQMRPRQLIVLCNFIAAQAIRRGNFPRFTVRDIVEGVEEGEHELATEIVNSYSLVHPNVADIVRALRKMPMTFGGEELEKRARESARFWRNGPYDPAAFQRLVVELGIVGRVEARSPSGHVSAEFEYAQPRRLALSSRDECVIHPMFFGMLDIEPPDHPLLVVPFLAASQNDAALDTRWRTSDG